MSTVCRLWLRHTPFLFSQCARSGSELCSLWVCVVRRGNLELHSVPLCDAGKCNLGKWPRQNGTTGVEEWRR